MKKRNVIKITKIKIKVYYLNNFKNWQFSDIINKPKFTLYESHNFTFV